MYYQTLHIFEQYQRKRLFINFWCRYDKRVTDVILIGIVVSSALAIIKIVGGILGNAQSLMFDGINSLTDVLIAIECFYCKSCK